MAFGRGNMGQQMSEINVTPFVDVMLVLLVIFMVTAPLMQRGVNVELPQAKAGTIKAKEDQLMVTVTKKGEISLQNQTMTIPELGKKLLAIAKTNKNAEVYLSADRSVPYGTVVQVIATVKNSGITRLGMVTELPPAEVKR